MFHTIEEFMKEWNHESASTKKLFAALTDEALNQQVGAGRRTIGRLASHLIVSPHEMLTRTDLRFEAPFGYDHVPSSAAEIVEAYRSAEQAMREAIRTQWTDENLRDVRDMYGEQWSNAVTLRVVIQHEVHHRAQMTVLMRQAGLKIPGMYGPVYEEWEEFGMKPPVV